MVSKPGILDRIKVLYKIKNNVELARFLSVTPQNISNWYSRNSLNFDKVIEKCADADLNWLIRGCELKTKRQEQYPPAEENACSVAADLTVSYQASPKKSRSRK